MINVIVFILTALEVLTALLLVGIILIQQSKAGGGLGAVGGGVTETVFGATAGNVLTRGTVILASVFLGVTLLLAIITGQRGVGKSVVDDIRFEPAVSAEPVEPAGDSAAPVGDAGGDTPKQTAAENSEAAPERATAKAVDKKTAGDAEATLGGAEAGAKASRETAAPAPAAEPAKPAPEE